MTKLAAQSREAMQRFRLERNAQCRRDVEATTAACSGEP